MIDGDGSQAMGIGTFDVSMTEIDKWKKGERWYEERRALVNVDRVREAIQIDSQVEWNLGFSMV